MPPSDWPISKSMEEFSKLMLDVGGPALWVPCGLVSDQRMSACLMGLREAEPVDSLLLSKIQWTSDSADGLRLGPRGLHTLISHNSDDFWWFLASFCQSRIAVGAPSAKGPAYAFCLHL